MSSSPTLNQVHFRFRTDGGAIDDTPTWGAAEDTNYTIAVETNFRLRVSVQNTGTASSTSPIAIRVSKNSGTYTAVTTTSGATVGAQSADASTSADATSGSVLRLTAGAGTAETSVPYDETGSITSAITNGRYREFEFGLILKTAGATGGDTFDFRLYHATSTAFGTYSQTPRITARDLATGTYFDEKSGYTSATSDYNSAGHTTSVVTVVAGDGGAIGDLAVLAYTTDNDSTTTSGGTSGLASVTDSKGNTWSEAYSTNYSPGSVQSGANAGIFYSQLTTALAPADTITATSQVATEASRDAVALVVKMFAIAASRTVAVEATNFNNSTASTPPSLNATTANVECLRVRITGFESNTHQPLNSTGWVGLPVVTGNSGTSGSSQSLSSEFKISTGTSDASTPVAGTSLDMASVYVAFRTDAAADTEDDLLANDISSASNVTQPAVQQVHAILANDVASPSSVTTAALGGMAFLHGLHRIEMGVPASLHTITEGVSR